MNANAEEYLIEGLKELSSGTLREIVLYVDHSQLIDGAAIGTAIREHFSRRSTHLQKTMRRLLQRGFISHIIGLSFLTAKFCVAQVLGGLLGEHAVARILREGFLLIIGWVAMWKPLVILLYDWWPILSERRLCDRLSRVQVRLVAEKPR